MLRIGKSTDIHRLKPGGALKLGGITVSEERSAIAHSDGDGLLHAVAESLLGAAGLGDLGKHFPDDEARTKNMDSAVILKDVFQMIRNQGYRICNIDATVMIEKPKLRPYMEDIEQNIAALLGMDAARVNVKATRAEGIGAIGEGNAMMCEAVVLLERMLVKL